MTESIEQRWEARIARARELRERHAAAAKILGFYERVLQFQRDVAQSAVSSANAGVPLRKQIDVEFALANLPALLTVARESGPKGLSARARALQHYDHKRIGDLFLA